MVFGQTLGQTIQDINFGIYGADSTDIDLIAGIADLYPEENHTLPVTKTKFPIESGASRTDNAVVEPEILVLRGLVSDLTVGSIPFVGGVGFPNAGRSKEAWGKLRGLKNSRELVNVTTLLGLYENMLVTNIDAAVNRDTGKALFFTITLEETLIVETELVQIAATAATGPAQTKGSDIPGGTKQAEEPTGTQSSLLKDAATSISGIFN